MASGCKFRVLRIGRFVTHRVYHTNSVHTGVERRVTLSSIRAPKSGGRDRAGEPLARESKEFLRQRLIGKPYCCL